MIVSGHHSQDDLRDYQQTLEKQKQEMADLLNEK
jgi:hypothetical protein